MDAVFDKKILLENISYLLKEKEMKIGELEAAAKVSTGYISRITKEENSKPGIDFIMNVAEVLNIGMDTLLKVDLSAQTPTERYLISFFDKLIADTTADKLDWGVEKAGTLNRLDTDINGNVSHPLFEYETFMEEGESEYPEEVTRVVFPSHSFDVHTTIYGDCYNLRLKNGAFLYLMNICKSVYRVNDPDAFAKEAWLVGADYSIQFLAGTKDDAVLAYLVTHLYAAVAESMKHPKLQKGAKDAIEAFMRDDFTDDDEPPFF